MLRFCAWQLLFHCLSFGDDTDNDVKEIERECEGDVNISLDSEIPGLSSAGNQGCQSP
jgi:hypothetical protein